MKAGGWHEFDDDASAEASDDLSVDDDSGEIGTNWRSRRRKRIERAAWMKIVGGSENADVLTTFTLYIRQGL